MEIDSESVESKVYLDYNSTTPLAPEVTAAITESLHADWGNPSSDNYLGLRAQRTIKTARERVAKMINAESPEDIIFTSGGTESNNMAILSAVEWGKGLSLMPHVIMSNVEHVATSAMVKHLAEKGLIEYSEVPVDTNGSLPVMEVMSTIKDNTVLITVMMANNETGVVFPVHEIARELKRWNNKRSNRIWFHVDAAQAIGKLEVDVQKLEADYLTIVGHKFYGPRIGALYVRKIEEMRVVCPLVHGGGQESGFRSGTENTAMIAGLGAAALLVSSNLIQYITHMQGMRDYLITELKTEGRNGRRINGDSISQSLAGSSRRFRPYRSDERVMLERITCYVNCEESPRLPNTLSVHWNTSLTGHKILSTCTRLVASTRAACHNQDEVSEVLLKSGVKNAKSTVRLSVGRDTTKAEIDIAVDDIKKALLISC